MIAAHWALTYQRPIKGALLAAPADMERPFPAGYPDTATLAANGWLPLPRQPLPFPSIVAASTNDPLGDYERIAQFARDWRSTLVNVGAVGHLNPAAGFGEWPRALEFIRQLDT
jgi:predicted alpha/beta hydrolase family esterase